MNEVKPFLWRWLVANYAAVKLYDWKVSLSEKLVFKYTTLGLPFIRGFPSHEWNETHPLTMTGDQLY